MSFRCWHCDVKWWPFEAPGGVCPGCGGGTQRVPDGGDSERLVVRDRAARDSAQQLDDLEALAELPTVEPEHERNQSGGDHG